MPQPTPSFADQLLQQIVDINRTYKALQDTEEQEPADREWEEGRLEREYWDKRVAERDLWGD